MARKKSTRKEFNTSAGKVVKIALSDLAAVCRNPATGCWQLVPKATTAPGLGRPFFYSNARETDTRIVEVQAKQEDFIDFIQQKGVHNISVLGKIHSYGVKGEAEEQEEEKNSDCWILLTEAETIRPAEPGFNLNILLSETGFEMDIFGSLEDFLQSVPEEFRIQMTEVVTLPDEREEELSDFAQINEREVFSELGEAELEDLEIPDAGEPN